MKGREGRGRRGRKRERSQGEESCNHLNGAVEANCSAVQAI